MLAVGAIAALAGVSETTVRRALRQAKVLGFVTVEERRLSRFRNETNVVSIISSAWTSWLRLARQGGGCQSRKGTNTSDLDKDRQRPSEPSKGCRKAGSGSRSGLTSFWCGFGAEGWRYAVKVWSGSVNQPSRIARKP